MFTYTIPAGVKLEWAGGRPLLTLPEGGRVAIDRRLLALWQQVNGCDLPAALQRAAQMSLPAGEAAAALACLAQAGLLDRVDQRSAASQDAGDLPPKHRQSRVGPKMAYPAGETPRLSAIVVSYNSRDWLPACFESLFAQSVPPDEVILVDNASSDDSAGWTAAHYPQVRLLRLDTLQPFSQALNQGMALATAAYCLLLNPDVVMDRQALAWMLSAAADDPGCAAVGAKLRFLWAPAFLNGLGNEVGAWSWGTDCALGWLDLGQFDGWQELPSACFAAALVRRDAYAAVGPFDEGFPMYYEDTEWCYRARLFGYTIRPAPHAVVYHAFSSRVPAGRPVDLPALKLSRVVYGRLRWITRLLGCRAWLRFALNYLLEDLARMAMALLTARVRLWRAYGQAWGDFRRSLPGLRQERRRIQSRRRVADRTLFRLQRAVPQPLIWRGMPWLTWDIIQAHYAPWLAVGPFKDFPEWQGDTPAPPPPATAPPLLPRLRTILRSEGLSALVYHLGRWLLWKLSRP